MKYNKYLNKGLEKIIKGENWKLRNENIVYGKSVFDLETEKRNKDNIRYNIFINRKVKLI